MMFILGTIILALHLAGMLKTSLDSELNTAEKTGLFIRQLLVIAYVSFTIGGIK